jgi:quercetin dioxygenase-like cupin family protein
MKIATLFYPILAIALCQQAALAFEPSPKVKVTTILKTEKSWDGQPLVYPPGQAEITGMFIDIAPGAETGWHLHPVPSFGMLMEGELEVQLEDGRVKKIQAGESLAEVVNVRHNGRNTGQIPARILVFYAGAVGQPLTVPKP